MDAQDGFTEVAQVVKAQVAEFETELVFALGVKAAVTFVAGCEFRTLMEFAHVNFWMNF